MRWKRKEKKWVDDEDLVKGRRRTSSSLWTTLPLILAVFLFGLLVGSSMRAPATPDASSQLPLEEEHGVLRGAAPIAEVAVARGAAPIAAVAPTPREPRAVAATEPRRPPPVVVAQEAPRKEAVPKRPASGNNHPVVRNAVARSARIRSLKSDLSSEGYADAAGSLDSGSVTVCAWVFLAGGNVEPLIKTIVSNKASGCDIGSDGFALTLNEWETDNRLPVLEWGDQGTGCRKLVASKAVDYDRWTHVCATLDVDGAASLSTDGEIVAAASGEGTSRTPQRSKRLRLGQYPDGTFPLVGNISSLVVLDIAADDSALAELYARSRPGDDPRAALGSFAHKANIRAAFSCDPMVQGKGADRLEMPPKRVARPPAVVKSTMTGDRYAIGFEPGGVVDRADSDARARPRAEAVRGAMSHAWRGYKSHAWGRDELKPQSGRGTDNWGGMGVTLVDSLDTLWLMGLKSEFEEAANWVGNSLRFDHTGDVSVFETTIRELGGLLAAYDLSKKQVFLEKAQDLGTRLLSAFDTPTGIPKGTANLRDSRGRDVGWTGGNAVLSELGSLQVEFRYLAHATGDKVFAEKVNKVFERMSSIKSSDGLYPIYVSPKDGALRSRKITFGALGDSFYEYLLKVWLQGGKRETRLRQMYDEAVDGMIKKLLNRATPSDLAYVADLDGAVVHKMDHLVCFLPGTLALGAKTDPLGSDSPRAKRDMHIAQALMYTCVEMYSRFPTKLSPEFVTFQPGRDFQAASSAPFYILRPETSESLFYLHELTGEPIYREWAWQIFSAIESKCKLPHGYGSHPDVRDPHRKPDDRMESFFLAETLKYLYLIQDPDHQCQLDRVVFNTEAHPLTMLGADGVHISSALSGH